MNEFSSSSLAGELFSGSLLTFNAKGISRCGGGGFYDQRTLRFNLAPTATEMTISSVSISRAQSHCWPHSCLLVISGWAIEEAVVGKKGGRE